MIFSVYLIICYNLWWLLVGCGRCNCLSFGWHSLFFRLRGLSTVPCVVLLLSFFFFWTYAWVDQFFFTFLFRWLAAWFHLFFWHQWCQLLLQAAQCYCHGCITNQYVRSLHRTTIQSRCKKLPLYERSSDSSCTLHRQSGPQFCAVRWTESCRSGGLQRSNSEHGKTPRPEASGRICVPLRHFLSLRCSDGQPSKQTRDHRIYEHNGFLCRVLKVFHPTEHFNWACRYWLHGTRRTYNEEEANSACLAPQKEYLWLDALHPTTPIHNAMASEVAAQMRGNERIGRPNAPPRSAGPSISSSKAQTLSIAIFLATALAVQFL